MSGQAGSGRSGSGGWGGSGPPNSCWGGECGGGAGRMTGAGAATSSPAQKPRSRYLFRPAGRAGSANRIRFRCGGRTGLASGEK